MDECVLDEVVQRLFEPRLVAVHDGPAGVGDSKWASGSTGERVEPESDAFEQRVRVDGFSPQWQKALVVAGDEQQILGEPSQAVRFLRRRAQGAFELLLRARAAKGELELRLEQRERRAQFVARVVDEAALVLDCGLEAREHFVQRLREAGELVPAARLGQSCSRRRRADRCGPSAHGLDGPQRTGGE